ncbi:ORF6N domain-containing protein [Pedobacter glucosidilyticus]|uniref:ORF6N domain-containing protein n=1 Tax=Pedobacter glucosidilyticus TaxID=1122941 RepID=UPI0026EF4FEE|nr:ORF6N domain-containing protein [Pedobacter glucosidilyticus]
MSKTNTKKQEISLPDEIVMNQIYVIREKKVMLDFNLAELYEVETRVLKQAVKRKINRFPEDFMFQLTKAEWQEVITNCDKLPDRIKFSPITPLAFTEQGVAMLSSILNSERAIFVNIQIIRVFTKLRQFLTENTEIRLEIAEIKSLLEKHTKLHVNHDKNMEVVFQYLDELADKKEEPQQKRKRIGYKEWEEENG